MHAQFPAQGSNFGIDVDHFAAGLNREQAVSQFDDTVERHHVEHNTTFERDGLAIVTGAPAARGQGNTMLGAESDGGDHIGFATRTDDEVRGFLIELLFQDGAVPKEVTAFLTHQCPVGNDGDVTEFCCEGGPVHFDPLK